MKYIGMGVQKKLKSVGRVYFGWYITLSIIIQYIGYGVKI